MKFVCDNCGTQYLISDEKVGPKGVKIRCKRCGNIILLRPGGGETAQATDPTGAPLAQHGSNPPAGGPGLGGAEEQDELGQAFDQLLKGGFDAGEEDEDDDEARATEIFSMEELERLRDGKRADTDQDKIDEVFSQAESTGVPASRSQPGEESREEWYVAIDDEQVGPLGLVEIENRWEAGDIGPGTLAWHPGMDDWTAVRDVPKLRYLLGGGEARDVPAVVGEEAPAAAADAGEEWAPSTGSTLSALVEEEMHAAQSTPPEEEEEPDEALADDLPSDDVGAAPWEKEDVASGEVARPSDSFFDSTLDQSTTDGAYPTATTRGALARPAYLSGEAKSKSPKKFLILGAIGFVVVVGVAIAVVNLTGEEQTQSNDTMQPLEPAKAPTDKPGKTDTAVAANSKDPAEDPATKPAEKPGADEPKKDESAQGEAKDPDKKKVEGEGKDVLVVKKAGTEVEKPDPVTDRTPGKKRKKRKKTKVFSRAKEPPPETPKKETTPPPASGDVPETLSKAQIAKTMKKYIPAMKGCVQQQQQRDPTVKGTMYVSFTISGGGTVQLVKILSAEHQGTYVAGCIEYLIKNMKFPKFSGSPVTVPKVPLRLGG